MADTPPRKTTRHAKSAKIQYFSRTDSQTFGVIGVIITCFARDLGPTKFELQSAVKIELQSVLAWFTYWILLYRRVESGLSGLHRLYTIKFQANFHPLYGKSGLTEIPLRQIPKNDVLLFETTPVANPVGGRSLIRDYEDEFNGRGCVILFGDLHLEFVKTRHFDGLKWES